MDTPLIDNHSTKPAAYCNAGDSNALIKKGFFLLKNNKNE